MGRLPAEGPVRGTALYYLIAAPLTFFFAFSGLFRSTVCGPNFDVVFSFIFVIVAFIAGLRQLRLGIVNKARRSEHFRAAIIHAVMLVLFIAVGSL